MKKNSLTPLTMLIACIPVLSSQAVGAPAAPPTPVERVGVSAVDSEARELIEKLVHIGAEEIELSRIAVERALHPEVKRFAEESIAAQTSFVEELKSLLSAAGQVPVAERPRLSDERSWRTKDSDEFDEDYVDKMIDLHEDYDDLLSDAAKSDQPQIRAFGERHRPSVKRQLEQAKALAKAID